MTHEEALYVLKNTAWLGTDADREKVEEAIRTLYIAERPEPTCINSEKMHDIDDPISRQAAIDEAEEWIEAIYCEHTEQRERDAIKHVINGIKALPSVQLDPCDVCAHKDDCGDMRIYCPAERRTDDCQ